MLGNLEQANRIAELKAIEARTRREDERNAAIAENNRDRLIDYDSREALARGDKQRETGVYQTGDEDYDATGQWENEGGYHSDRD